MPQLQSHMYSHHNINRQTTCMYRWQSALKTIYAVCHVTGTVVHTAHIYLVPWFHNPKHNKYAYVTFDPAVLGSPHFFSCMVKGHTVIIMHGGQSLETRQCMCPRYIAHDVHHVLHYTCSFCTNSSHSIYHQMYTTLTISCLLGSAPLSSNSCTVSWWPFSLAIWRAVFWYCDRYQNREPSVLTQTHMYVYPTCTAHNVHLSVYHPTTHHTYPHIHCMYVSSMVQ